MHDAERLVEPALTLGKEFARRNQRLEQLLEKKGVALREGIDGVEEFWQPGTRKREAGLHHRLNLGGPERRQMQFLCQPLAIHLRQNITQPRVDFLAAIGKQQQECTCPTPPCQKVQQFQAGLITPVQIFDDKQQRLMRGESRQKASKPLKELAFL